MGRIQSAWYKLRTYLLIAPLCSSFGQHSNIVKPVKISGLRWIKVGNYTRVNAFAFIVVREGKNKTTSLSIGNGVVLGHFNHIVATNQVIIKDDVLTADKVFITDSYHGYEDISIPIIKQEVKSNGITTIGEGSWIGDNVSIISSRVGKHCVIGANSVVISDIPDYSVAVGNPARVVKHYNFETEKWEKVKKDENRFW